ncbi:cytochrome c [Loktanella sp. IMCC34160]|uniref:c-type cytochrome n=1 Tax=Loktanella sp. IMCC34160 TaxID=2510646 RepID=UPI00101B7A69|nr:cytochrome c [Loktanella sp. IMCC34160]RYG92099.1 cytochrome c [Loktanella sp. IMCC34160]
MRTLALSAGIALTAATLALTSTATAESHVDPAIAGAIKARQAHMQLYAHNIGVLGGMAQGRIDYDADLASAAASNLAALSQLNQMTYWPAGSDNASVDGTKALPAIWDDLPGVMARGAALVEASAAMEAAAGGGLESLQGAMQALGGACGACHQNYRQSDN